jgi:predicted anti-sigma-YlaC factor YlaD
MRAILPADCARARQQLSLRVDSELSEFENVLLEAHLARCTDCEEVGQSLSDLTKTLRMAPAEQPSVSFHVRRSRTRRDALRARALRAGSAAAAVAVALTGLVALHGATSGVRGVDLGRARLVLGVHERQLQELDSFGRAPRPEVPHGLAAAENVGRR